MGDLLKLRVSQLNRYNDCARGNAISFMRKEIEAEGHEIAECKSSIGAAMGTAIHALVAELLKQKMSYGTMDLADAMAARDAAFLEEIEKGITWDATTPHIDRARKQLEAYGRAFLPLAQLIDPIAVEDELQWLVSPLGDEAVPILLIGHRDVKDKRYEIHDHKTGASFPSCHAQLGGYALLDMYNGGEVQGVRVNYAPRLPAAHLHETQVRSIKFDLDVCIKAAWNNLKTIQRHYMQWLETKDKESFPANPYSQSCTMKYCQAYCTSWCQVGGADEIA